MAGVIAPDPTSSDLRIRGMVRGMDPKASSRAHLLPEEEAVGSDDPAAQADLILEESEARTAAGRTPPDSDEFEQRTSDEATPPT